MKRCIFIIAFLLSSCFSNNPPPTFLAYSKEYKTLNGDIVYEFKQKNVYISKTIKISHHIKAFETIIEAIENYHLYPVPPLYKDTLYIEEISYNEKTKDLYVSVLSSIRGGSTTYSFNFKDGKWMLKERMFYYSCHFD